MEDDLHAALAARTYQLWRELAELEPDTPSPDRGDTDLRPDASEGGPEDI